MSTLLGKVCGWYQEANGGCEYVCAYDCTCVGGGRVNSLPLIPRSPSTDGDLSQYTNKGLHCQLACLLVSDSPRATAA